jgi:aromatic-L-amino-acid/L-tryptophan decarboxylase
MLQMLNQIHQLEKISRQLEATPTQRTEWNAAVQHFADDFIMEVDDVPAFGETTHKGIGLLNHPIGDEPREIDFLLNVIKENIYNNGINCASGNHLGYIPGGGLFPTALGDYLAAVGNQYAGFFFANPGAARMESLLLRWLCEIIGFPSTAAGNLTSGGSIANLIAITAARDEKGISSKKVTKSVIYLTVQVHHCVQKAIRIAGLVEAHIRYVPMDAHYRMDADALASMVAADKKARLQPFLVVASAGTTDTGAVDPLDKIAHIAEKYNLWYHIDAAYGGAFILVDAMKSIFKGIERADSVAMDPHKGLFISYGTGAILFKNTKAVMKTHYYRGNYMQDVVEPNDEFNAADLSPELTKHFRGLRMWLPLQLFGLKPFRAALEEKILLCHYFYGEIQKMGFEVGPFPDLSVIIYRYVPKNGTDSNIFNEKLVEAIRLDGRVFLSSTTIDGVYWIRLAVLSFRTHLDIIEKCLQAIREKVVILEKE